MLIYREKEKGREIERRKRERAKEKGRETEKKESKGERETGNIYTSKHIIFLYFSFQIMPQVQDPSLDLLTCSPVYCHCAMAAPLLNTMETPVT